MNYEPKIVILKNGRKVILRPVGPSDAAQMLDYLRATSGETPFMVRYPEEVTMSLAQEEQMVCARLENPFLADTAAFTDDGLLMGNCSVTRISDRYKQCHRVELGISIYEKYWHMGLGTVLMEHALDASRNMEGIEQVELSVMSKNRRAIPLYERLGFVRVGEVPRAFRFRDGTYDSEIIMIKDL